MPVNGDRSPAGVADGVGVGVALGLADRLGEGEGAAFLPPEEQPATSARAARAAAVRR
jgi:hypothetical protein